MVTRFSIAGVAVVALAVVAVAVAGVCVRAEDDSGEPAEPAPTDFSAVTCGSAVKLRHQSTGFLLHSHNIKWGSGSGQQSVTAVENNDDPNSLWQVKEAVNADVCLSGTPLKCGDVIRLVHVQTRLHLHSHLHTAPVSGRQEISCYGADTQTDTGDNWRVECTGGQKAGSKWLRDTAVTLTHVDTGAKLFTGKDAQFTNANCRGCPILGQLEVSCLKPQSQQQDSALWKVDDGIFFPDLTAVRSAKSN